MENRSDSVERLWDEAREDLPEAREVMKRQLARDEQFFQARDAGAVGVGCLQRSRDVMRFALLAVRDGASDWSVQLGEASSLMYWAYEILQTERVVRRIGPEWSDSFLLERIWLHGLAAGGGAGSIADWTAAHLSDVFAATGGTGKILELEQDQPYCRFIGHLIDASVQGRWPEDVDRIAMGAYGELLASAQEPEAFRKALVSFCDYRVARALGYDGIGATRRSRTESVLDVGWIRLFPVELFSLRYVYQKTTGKALSLVTDHPLLSASPMKMPALLPLYEDDHIRRAVALAKEVFGSAWRPVVA